MMAISNEMRSMILERVPSHHLRQVAVKEGMVACGGRLAHHPRRAHDGGRSDAEHQGRGDGHQVHAVHGERCGGDGRRG